MRSKYQSGISEKDLRKQCYRHIMTFCNIGLLWRIGRKIWSKSRKGWEKAETGKYRENCRSDERREKSRGKKRVGEREISLIT